MLSWTRRCRCGASRGCTGACRGVVVVPAFRWRLCCRSLPCRGCPRFPLAFQDNCWSRHALGRCGPLQILRMHLYGTHPSQNRNGFSAEVPCAQKAHLPMARRSSSGSPRRTQFRHCPWPNLRQPLQIHNSQFWDVQAVSSSAGRQFPQTAQAGRRAVADRSRGSSVCGGGGGTDAAAEASPGGGSGGISDCCACSTFPASAGGGSCWTTSVR